MHFLLLGGEGQLGWELRRALAPLGTLIALTRRGERDLSADLTQPNALAATIRDLAPNIVINAAAYTAVDRAESEPEQVAGINATAPGVLAAEAKSLGAFLVHYSTDYVFDGSGERPWREDDSTGRSTSTAELSSKGRRPSRRAGAGI